MPADVLSPVPPSFGQFRRHPAAVPEGVPGLLERLGEVPDRRDPRERATRPGVVLALTAYAVLSHFARVDS